MSSSLQDLKLTDLPASVQSESDMTIDPAMEKRVLWKLDLCIIPIVTIFYLLSFLDRANTGNARVAGLQTELGLTNFEYELAITFTYVPYILSELPSNLLLKAVGPELLLPTIVTCWGIITMCQGFVHSVGAFIALRVLLGLFEGGLLPGIVLYVSTFYLRAELQWRTGMIFSATSLAGAFSGLIAAAIEGMGGDKGWEAWSWIFIIEGAVTAFIGVISFLLLPRAPGVAKFLTLEEREILLARLQADRPEGKDVDDDDRFEWAQVRRAILEAPQLWILALGLFANGMTLFGLAYFLPSITEGFGFSATQTQLLTVPPYAVAFVVTMTLSYLSDKYRMRGISIVLMGLLALIGFVLFYANINFHISYLGLFFAVTGSYCTAPAFLAWLPNNAAPYYKRASVLAFGLILTNAGGIASTWVFPAAAAPLYRGGTIFDIISACVTVITAGGNIFWISWATKRKSKKRDELLAPFGDDDKRAWKELGDNHPDFVWMY